MVQIQGSSRETVLFGVLICHRKTDCICGVQVARLENFEVVRQWNCESGSRSGNIPERSTPEELNDCAKKRGILILRRELVMVHTT